METIHDLIGSHGESLAWWQMSCRAILVFFFGLVLIRLAGKRVRGRWGAMDIIIFVMIGSNLSRALTGNAPFVATLAATAALLALHALLAAAAVRVEGLGPFLKGRPCRLMRDGEVDARALRRHSVGMGDLEEAIRTAGLRSTAEVAEAWIERNGHISIIRR